MPGDNHMLRTLTLSAATLLALVAPVVAQEAQPPSQQSEQSQTQSQTPSPTSQPAQPQSQPAQQKAQQSAQKQAQDQGGLKTAVPATYYTLQQADLRASDLIGMDVHNTNNDEIGEIKDLIIEDGKNLKAIVIDVGGFL